jgi:hypothetical protein
MSALTPRFWANPIRFVKYAAREKPAYFWSVVLGSMGPLMMVVVPPIRRAVGDYDAPPIPLTYPSTSTCPPSNMDVCWRWITNWMQSLPVRGKR